MHLFSGETINSVYLSALKTARETPTEKTTSRDGLVFDLGPACFEFTNPENQILTIRNRNYNPYFAIIEASWVLSGNNDLEPLTKIIKDYGKYSDDGSTLNGAYGHRIRNHFRIDQIESAINLLRADPASRRAVVTLYSPNDLTNQKSLDIPCNISFCLKVRNGLLDITVFNRSNDLFLGIPYNVFVFNIVQRYAASRLNLGLGTQRHFTDSLHLYERNISTVDEILRSNTQNEITNWQSAPTPSYLYDCIISEYEKIHKFSFDEINCEHTRKALSAYLKLRTRDTSFDFDRELPYDSLRISIDLWLKSPKE